MSENKIEHAFVHKLMSVTIGIAGCVYIGYGIYMASKEFEEFATWNNLREFSIPIILSLLFLPYLYLIGVLTTYERIWIGLRFDLKNDSLHRYAIFQAMIRFRFDLEGLRRWRRNIGVHRPESREAILESISEIKKYQKREKNPHSISTELGWCPIAATEFLLSENLKTSDYHRTCNGEWWAGSTYLDINKESLFSSNIAYYISGDENAVKRLKLVLNVNKFEDQEAAEKIFFELCEKLLKRSIDSAPSNFSKKISHSDYFEKTIQGRRIKTRKETHANNSRGGYSRTLTIDYNRSYLAN